MARKEKIIHYLYKTTCLVTDRYYIGMHSTNNLEDGYMGSGRRLTRSLRKHGIDNHVREILEYFETRELLVEGEKKAITLDMLADDNCMNLKGGGDGGFISDEQQRHRSSCAGKARAVRLKIDLEYAKRTSEISSKIMKENHINGKMRYDTFIGKKHSEETKQLLSEIRKGTGIGASNSQYGTCWITKDGENKKIKKEEIETFIQEGWVKGRR